MWSRSCSKLGAGPSSGGSKAAAQPTCIWAEAVSTSRKDMSSAQGRFGAIFLSPLHLGGESLLEDSPKLGQSKRKLAALSKARVGVLKTGCAAESGIL